MDRNRCRSQAPDPSCGRTWFPHFSKLPQRAIDPTWCHDRVGSQAFLNFTRKRGQSLPSLRLLDVDAYMLSLRRRSAPISVVRDLCIDLTVIRDYLGHASITTTNRYVSTNLKMKTDALAAFWKRAGIATAASVPWKPTPTLLEFLRSL